MPPRARFFPALAVITALALGQGCVGTPTGPGGGGKGASGDARPGLTASTAASPRPLGPATPSTGTTRVVEAGVVMQLTGKVKVLSDYGVGVIGQNGANVVASNSGRVISNQGGNVISGAGGGMIGKTKFFRLAQAAAPPEDLLADAVIEVLDAAGRVLTDKAGVPITATSDAGGSYTLAATLPPENLVLRVRLAEGGTLRGGELTALVAGKPAAGPVTVALDTASSLGAAYVLGKYVKGRQDVLDRLPRAESEALAAGMEAARAKLPREVPVYTAEALALAAEGLRAKDAPLAATLDRIEAILLAGQANLGEGLDASRVPLAFPIATAAGPDGAYYVAEGGAGRVRRIGRDGAVALYAGAGATPGRREAPSALDATLEPLTDMAVLPDGGLLVVESSANQIRKLTPDGRVEAFAGTGEARAGEPGGRAATTPILRPLCAAVAPDGTVYVGEGSSDVGRLLAIAPDGTLGVVGTLERQWTSFSSASGLAFGADGTLYVATGRGGRVLARRPGGWEVLAEGLEAEMNEYSRLAPAPGGVYLGLSRAHRVDFVGDDGTRRPVAGTGVPGYAGDGGPATRAQLQRPVGLTALADGRLLIADGGNAVVRAIRPAEPDAPIATVAGTASQVQVGDALALAVSAPSGVDVDAEGRLVIAELGGGTIKRLDGGKLAVLAGSTTGHADGPAADARFNSPGDLAFDRAGALWVFDAVSPRLRRLRPDGMVETMAGTAATGVGSPPITRRATPADQMAFGRPLYLAIGPDDRPYWTDNAFNVVARLSAAGQVEIVAGLLPAAFDQGGGGDDGPADQATFNKPTGLAFDSRGDLYVADGLNMAIRKIAGATGPSPLVSTIAGLGNGPTLARLLTGDLAQPARVPGAEAILLAPTAIAIDAQDRLYVAEAGSARGASLLGAAIPFEVPAASPARIRRIDLRDPAYPVTTIAGPGGKVLAEAAGDRALGVVTGLAFDREGRLVVLDATNNQIKLIPRSAL